jgi:hypothetical protein
MGVRLGVLGTFLQRLAGVRLDVNDPRISSFWAGFSLIACTTWSNEPLSSSPPSTNQAFSAQAPSSV